MGSIQQEHEYSCELILGMARDQCTEGFKPRCTPVLRPDVENSAALVLAAPDLLAACKAMLDIDNPEPGHQGHITAGEARRMAADAIRKAEPT